MNILKRYDNFFMREFMRVKFKFYIRENAIVENFISFSNDDNDYLFYNTFSLSFISRNKKCVIE